MDCMLMISAVGTDEAGKGDEEDGSHFRPGRRVRKAGVIREHWSKDLKVREAAVPKRGGNAIQTEKASAKARRQEQA